MRKLIFVAGIAAIAAGVMIVSASAQQAPAAGAGPMMRVCPCGGRGTCHGILARAEELKLTDKQVAALKKLSRDSASTMIDLKASLQKAELKLDPLLDADEIDLKAARKQLNVCAKAWVELRLARIKHRAGIKKILSKEQLKQCRGAMRPAARGGLRCRGPQRRQGPMGGGRMGRRCRQMRSGR